MKQVRFCLYLHHKSEATYVWFIICMMKVLFMRNVTCFDAVALHFSRKACAIKKNAVSLQPLFRKASHIQLLRVNNTPFGRRDKRIRKWKGHFNRHNAKDVTNTDSVKEWLLLTVAAYWQHAAQKDVPNWQYQTKAVTNTNTTESWAAYIPLSRSYSKYIHREKRAISFPLFCYKWKNIQKNWGSQKRTDQRRRPTSNIERRTCRYSLQT